MSDDKKILLCARADSGSGRVPGTVFTHSCTRCGEKVCVSPSSFKVLEDDPAVEIVCMWCVEVTAETKVQITDETWREFLEWLCNNKLD